MFDKEKKDEIISALVARAPQLECPMCHGKQFTFVDGYILYALQEKTNSMRLGPTTFLPSIQIVCSKCGFISSHALGTLGLLPQDINDDSNNAINESGANK